MKLGITGNTGKPGLWKPVADLISLLEESDYPYVLHPELGSGLSAEGYSVNSSVVARDLPAFLAETDIVISFGGDGTLLNTVYEIGSHPIPILGVNYGRLGFLAHVEQSELISRMHQLEKGDFQVEERFVLEGTFGDPQDSRAVWALNEFTIQRSGATGLMAIEVDVDGIFLNTYWADGLIVSTPTGSTAYSLALGGPIMAPGCGSILISPIAPHSLTVRPIVIPDSSEIVVRVLESEKPHVFTADGIHHNNLVTKTGLHIRRAGHPVKLVRFPDQDHFSTLRTKLMWGARKSNQAP